MSRSARRDLVTIVGVAVVLAGILLLWAAVPKADAAKPVAMYAEFQGGMTNAYRWVEQQSNGGNLLGDAACNEPVTLDVVCNNTVDPDRDGPNDPRSCLWDVDDHTRVSWFGDYLKPGQSVSITKCLIADTGWVFGIKGVGLTLTISFDLEQGRDFSLTAPVDFCVGGPRVRDDSPMRVEIPDSYGGTGIPATVTWTATNETDRTIRASRSLLMAGSGNLGYSPEDGLWCPEGWPLVHNGNFTGGFDAEGIGYWWDQ